MVKCSVGCLGTDLMLESIIAWLLQADPMAVYLFVLVISLLENLFPPIPGDLPIAFVGYLAYLGGYDMSVSLVCATLGSVGGFMLVFQFSDSLGARLYASGVEGESVVPSGGLSKVLHRLFPPDQMVLFRERFVRHGYVAVLLNRFFFGSRSVVSVMAGLLHLKTVPVFLAALTSSLTWNAVLLAGGYLLGSKWQDIGEYVAMYTIPVSLLFFFVLFFAIRNVSRQRKAER